MQVFNPLLVLLLAGSIPLLCADERRQHGAHEHGVGKLDIAQDGSELIVEFESPAANIIGFEHAPMTREDHDSLRKALIRLKDGAGLFRFPEAAGCRLVRADVATPLENHKEGTEEHQAGNEHHRDDSSHKEARAYAEEQHNNDDSHDHEGRRQTDITAAYRFICAHSEKLDQVSVRLLEMFPMTERLQVRFITGKHQGTAELSASRPVLRL